VIEEKLSKVWTLIQSLEGRFDNLEEKQSELKGSIEGRLDNLERETKESMRFLKQWIIEIQEKSDKKMKKLQRKLNNRIDNISAARNLPVYPRPPRSSYVAEGKPDYANYVSNDKIEPLPKFYR